MFPRSGFGLAVAGVVIHTVLIAPAVAIEPDGSCPLLALLPFTDVGQELLTFRGREQLRQPPSPAFSHMAAALMAVDDFNSRDPSVVPELVSDPSLSNCTLRISSLRAIDTQSRSPSPAIPRLMADVLAGRVPCAIVGPRYNDVALETGAVAFGLDVPLISHGAVTNKLRSYPTSMFTTAHTHALADAVASYLRSIGRTDYLGVLRQGNDPGQEWSASLENSAKDDGFSQVRHAIFDKRYVSPAIEELKSSGYRTVVSFIHSTDAHFQVIADAAAEAKLSGEGPGVFWLLTGNVDMDQLVHLAEENANAAQLLKGSAVVKMLDGFAFDPDNDKFLRSWRARDEDFARRVNEVNPIPSGEPGYRNATEDYFRTVMPEAGAAFLYDAVMAVGIGGCRSLADAGGGGGGGGGGGRKGGRKKKEGEQGGGEGRRTQRQGPGPKHWNGHLEGILASEFTGATGQLQWGEDNRQGKTRRRRETVAFGVYNFQESDEGIFHYKLTNILRGNTTDETLWEVGPDGPFVYADGTEQPPPLLRDIPEQNFLSFGVHVFGLSIMSVALALAALAFAFVFFFRGTSIVKAAQPEFLVSLIFGSVLMSLGILTISFVESCGWDGQMLSKACMSIPWLVVIGHVTTYCALFTKTWRINKVMQIRRRKVALTHVLGPFVALVSAAVVVLTVWTAVDPLLWERDEINEVTGESYGKCQSNHHLAYLIPLILLMVIATALTAIMAWKTKDIDKSFSESSWIFYTIVLQIQVLLIGIPVIVILENASADAAYIGLALVIWSFPMSTLLLIIGPKVIATYNLKRGNSTGSARSRGGISANRPQLGGQSNVHVSGLNLTSPPPGLSSSSLMQSSSSVFASNRSSSRTNVTQSSSRSNLTTQSPPQILPAPSASS